LSGLKVISFDVGGTLVDHNFVELVWNVGVPRLYAEKNGIPFKEAREHVVREYERVGRADIRWYLLQYWFDLFGLSGSPRELLDSLRHEVRVYPEVPSVLENLERRYDLVVVSNAPIDILSYEIEGLRHYFTQVFSSITDFGLVRKTAEMYTDVCTILGRKPEQVLHIGDDEQSDFEAAREAGMQALHLDRSMEGDKDHTIADLKELEELLPNTLEL